jgi:catecholate siderophore receptor
MRFSSLPHSGSHPFFHISRHTLGTTTVLLTSAAGFQGALAQTAAAGEGGPGAASQEKEEIVVTGRRSVVNEKLGGSVQDAPQSINLVTAKTLQEEAVTNMQDALKNVPGITLNAGEGTARGDTVNLRGFPAFNDFFLDGIRDAGNYTRDTFNLETLEVLEGPSAILFGRGSTGGVINQVTKAAGLNAIQSATIQTGTNGEARFTGDYDMPIGPSAAIRVNGMFERSGVVDRDNVLNRRYGIAPTFSYGIGEKDSVDLSFLHQHENDRPDESIPFLHGAPAPVPRGADYGLNSDRFITSADIATLRVRHEFTDDFSVSNVFRSGLYTFQSQRSFPNFGSEVIGSFEPASQVLVGRDDPNSSGTQRNLTDQLDFKGHFETGPVTQDVTIGLEYGRETNDLTRYSNPFNKNNNWIPEIPLTNPNQNGAVPGIEPATSAQHTAALEQGVYFTDTIHIGQYFDLIGGARFDRFHATFTQNTFPTATAKEVDTNFGRTDNITSPRAALVYKPAPDLSVYFSYGTSFDPSAEALSLSAGTASLGPVKADSYEVGAKKEWLDGTLTTTAALFRTEVSNAQINDPERPGVVVLAGDQRVDGIELDASGHITPDWEILAGVIVLDPKTVGSLTPANVGKLLINSARAQANLWTEYYIDEHWEVGTGGNFLGHRYADLGNTANIPSYFLWNGMVTYKVNENYSFQMNIKNIMDRVYYDNAYFSSASENHITPGAGRTFTFTAHANF